MRRIGAIALLMSGMLALMSGVASASNGAETTQFRAQYANPLGGNYVCAGVRIVKTAPKAFTKDSEECTISNAASWPAGTYVGEPRFVVNGTQFRWFSDFDGQTADKVTIVVTHNGDGTAQLEITAYY